MTKAFSKVFAAAAGIAVALMAATRGRSQISLPTAVDVALTHSPKVRIAQADANKARASLDQAKDVYVPALTAGAGLGDSYGYSPNPPTLFTFNAQSLLFNYSQRDYIRGAHFGVNAADLALEDARQGVIEDVSLTFLAVQHDEQREGVLDAENGMAARLATIVEERLNAGRDTAVDLTSAQLTAAQFRLAKLKAEDDTARDRTHLALELGLPPDASVVTDGEFPAIAPDRASGGAANPGQGPGVGAAYETAQAKQQTAIGDARYLYRPQIGLILQYNRYATFTDSFKELQIAHGSSVIGANEGVFGVQIQIPLADKEHQAKARGSAADAMRALAEADDAQRTALDGQLKLRHSIAVLQAREEVAGLEQKLAQQQLDAVRTQLSVATTGAGPQMNPKDEQNSLIAEREKYLAVIDARFQLRQAEVNLLRQSNGLETWIRQAARGPALPAQQP